MPEPKKQSSPRKTGMRRSHIRLTLAKLVNSKSPVKAFETKKSTPRVRNADKKAAEAKKVVKITKPKPAKTTTTAKKPAKKA